MRELALLLLVLSPAFSEENQTEIKLKQHQEGSRILSDEQDELAADVQQLTIEQTHPKVINLFEEVEDAMDEASERLYEHDTGSVTIGAQTDVIETIYQAAQARQESSGGDSSNSPGSAMLDMMKRMLGKGGGKPQSGTGQQKGGTGQEGESQKHNTEVEGSFSNEDIERTVPKGSGAVGRSLPSEFRDALKAYNRAAEKLSR